MNNTLIAYFSRNGENFNVGNVEKGSGAILADMISEILGSDEYEICTEAGYPENLEECNKIARKEAEENARPELGNPLPDMDAITSGMADTMASFQTTIDSNMAASGIDLADASWADITDSVVDFQPVQPLDTAWAAMPDNVIEFPIADASSTSWNFVHQFTISGSINSS